MFTSRKKFRVLRPYTEQPNARPETEQTGESIDRDPDLQSRIGAVVRNRVAQSLREERVAHEEAMVSDHEDPDAPDTPAEMERVLSPREEIEKIKHENLTGRQLRIARRLAQKQRLQATSDLDAVRLLRKLGIDPFNRSGMMEVITGVPSEGGAVALPATVRLPQIKDPTPQPQIIDDDTREREVRKIQRDLVKRRRARLATLFVKLACYVALPSLLAGYYFYRVATPMYATYTEFVIQQAEAPGSIGGGSFFAGSPFATATDSITVQGYLTSRDAMLRLDENPGFRALFQADSIDALQRLDSDAGNEEAYGVYKKKVIIGFDPTEGVIKMEVISPSPESSLQISRALIGYAEEQVDQLTKRLRGDQMQGALESYETAEAKMEEAQERVTDLQRQMNTFDPKASFTLIMNQIAALDDQILENQLELAQLKDNVSPNQTKLRVSGTRNRVVATETGGKTSACYPRQRGQELDCQYQRRVDKGADKLGLAAGIAGGEPAKHGKLKGRSQPANALSVNGCGTGSAGPRNLPKGV